MKKTEGEARRHWLTVSEAAGRLAVDPSRIRQLLLKDQERGGEQRIFPSARKATMNEAKELTVDGRVRRVPRDGIWLIDAHDVARRQEKRERLGRPANGQCSYAECIWFRGHMTPAEEALVWACDGNAECVNVMLSEPLRWYYERCVSAEMKINGGWDVIEPRLYTEMVHEAYQQRVYGRVACLLAPFHDAFHLATVIEQVERAWRGLSL
jgi:hypothetical protein